ncbi:MAG: amidohydrolase family protein, partial [Chloroflexi bacterium]|nr:amidohydrolase family protein [Chloroflexota bacterium]
PDGGMEGLEAAKAYVREFEGRYDGRIRTMLYPNQTVSCGPDLLKATKAAAGELGVGIQLHAAQGLPEFHISLREYGVTPIQMLHEAGFLGPEVTLAHCVFDAGHSWCHYPYADDLGRLADAGVSIAHSPYKYAKMGIHAESFDRWRQRGINVCLGTDTFPQDIVAEMRWAAMGSRLAEGNYLSGQPRDVFDAATLGGAKSLGRTDIGRLAAGAKADILILNLRQIHFGGVRDPIASVVESATSSDVSSVIVDGRTLIENGQALALDEDRLLADLQSGCKEYWAGVSQWRARGESLDEIAPMSYPLA